MSKSYNINIIDEIKRGNGTHSKTCDDWTQRSLRYKTLPQAIPTHFYISIMKNLLIYQILL